MKKYRIRVLYLSNLEIAVEKAVELAVELPKLWLSGDLEEKRRIQNIVFPNGINPNYSRAFYSKVNCKAPHEYL